MKKVLILGASGLVGQSLIEELKDGFDIYGTYCSSSVNLPNNKKVQLEIHEIDKLKEVIRSIQPDIIISCLRGDFEQQLTFHHELSIEIQNTDRIVYYFSTTNVFDGDFSRPHTEKDFPISESDYGKFKINCENMLQEMLAERAIIIRIPAIWGKNSPRWQLIKDSIENNEVIDVYSNLICNNLSDVTLAKQLRFIVENNLKGIFHLGTLDMMSQADFFEQLVSKLTSKKNILRRNLYDNKVNPYYFSLQQNRNDIKDSLQSTNDDIVSYLLR
ncbi:sugar nucleotide-binding protein [Bacillus sp. JJ722]|uniref:sugar nucleotide-binding protein n=1 Tax=Bacillus sp. JJ722 TaxID=3122973 RepID=UPI002FFFD72C